MEISLHCDGVTVPLRCSSLSYDAHVGVTMLTMLLRCYSWVLHGTTASLRCCRTTTNVLNIPKLSWSSRTCCEPAAVLQGALRCSAAVLRQCYDVSQLSPQCPAMFHGLTITERKSWQWDLGFSNYIINARLRQKLQLVIFRFLIYIVISHVVFLNVMRIIFIIFIIVHSSYLNKSYS